MFSRKVSHLELCLVSKKPLCKLHTCNTLFLQFFRSHFCRTWLGMVYAVAKRHMPRVRIHFVGFGSKMKQKLSNSNKTESFNVRFHHVMFFSAFPFCPLRAEFSSSFSSNMSIVEHSVGSWKQFLFHFFGS